MGAGKAYANEARCLKKIGRIDEAIVALDNAHAKFIAAWDGASAKEVESERTSAIKALKRSNLV